MKTVKRNLNCRIMKRKQLKIVVSLMLVLTASCGEPETVVTDIVHCDGSIIRKIEMKSGDGNFKISNVQVPYDSTWTIRDSLEFSDKGDTTFVRKAEKLFMSVDELNKDYLTDSSANEDIMRRAEFRKRFRWFNNEYRFAEVIEKTMSYGYPVSDFLNEEELSWFYSPDNVHNEKRNGPDSLKYRTFGDSVDKKIEDWTMRNLVSEWIGEFSKLTKGEAEGDMTAEALKARESEFIKILTENEEKFDSLWTNGILLREFIGEANAAKYKTEADSAVNIVSQRLWVDFVIYSQRIEMPGDIIGTNGFLDSTKTLFWPIKSEFFMTDPYVMYAESKIPNKWTWIVSGLFLLFVLTGIVFRLAKK
jgi:hypothetical protein